MTFYMYSAISEPAVRRVREGKDTMVAVLAKLFRNEDGATALEYAFVASLISVVAFFVISSIGSSVSADFASIANAL